MQRIVKLLAHDLGFDLKDEAAAALAVDLEAAVRDVVLVRASAICSPFAHPESRGRAARQDGMKFARHSRRRALTTADMRRALALRGAPVSRDCVRARLHTRRRPDMPRELLRTCSARVRHPARGVQLHACCTGAHLCAGGEVAGRGARHGGRAPPRAARALHGRALAGH